MVLDLNTAEYAALVDAFKATPELCEVAELGSATCVALRRLEERMFNRALNVTSTDQLEEIAAFFGETPWWVADTSGLGPELEPLGFTRDYGWMKFSRGVGPREARSDLDVRLIVKDRLGNLHALLHAEQRRFLRVDQDRHDNPVEQPGAAGDDVDVAVGRRIERAGIDG